MKNFDDQILNKLEGKPTSKYELFHSQTSISYNSLKKLIIKEIPQVLTTVFFKGYARFESIILPQAKSITNAPLLKILKKRRSQREFNNTNITLKDLSTILRYSAGITHHNSEYKANRFYPSAGARYPLEVYVVPLHMSEIPNSVMHYYVKNNTLEKLFTLDTFTTSQYFMKGHEWVAKAGCILIITAVFERTTLKYGDRGYRHVLLEAGHLGQNISLVATALGMKSCCISGFIDESINSLLEIDGVKESVVYSCVIGK